MDNHLNDIELFEYANDLITDAAKLAGIQTHIKTCDTCQYKLRVEQGVDVVLKKELAVEHQVDVSQNVLHYFAKPSVKVVGVDVSWMIIMVMFVSALLIAGELSSFNDKIPQLSYATLIASAISSLMIVDFFFKYMKQRKQATS